MNSIKIKNFANESFTVKVGDVVGFKCDVEQYGIITEIRRRKSAWGPGDWELVLSAGDGFFHGDYIGGRSETTIDPRDAWVDGHAAGGAI